MAIGEGDIKYDTDYNLFVSDGDIVISDAKEQHVGDVVRAEKGWYKQWPTLGAAISRELDAPQQFSTIEQTIRVALRADGYRLDEVDISTLGDIVDITVTAATKTTDNTGGLL